MFQKTPTLRLTRGEDLDGGRQMKVGQGGPDESLPGHACHAIRRLHKNVGRALAKVEYGDGLVYLGSAGRPLDQGQQTDHHHPGPGDKKTQRK